MLSIKDLTVSYNGVTVLDRVSLELPAGGTLAVIGESGAGKSTLGLTAAGLIEGKVQGQVLWRGRDLYALSAPERVDITKRGEGLSGSAGLIPPDSEWFAPAANQYPPNPALMTQLLEGLGYVMSNGFFAKDGKTLELELIYSGGIGGSTNFTRDAEMIKQQLEKAGIKVTLRSMESKAVDDRVLNWNFDLALSGHGGLGGDPLQMNRSIIGKSFNSARYEANEELVKVLKQQLGAMDEQQRLALVQKAQELYADDLPALTLYYPKWYWAHDGRIDLYYTRGGVALGVPIVINRLAFVQ